MVAFEASTCYVNYPETHVNLKPHTAAIRPSQVGSQ